MEVNKIDLIKLQNAIDLIKKNKTNDAENILKELVDIKNVKPDVLTYLAICKIKSNKKNEAIDYLKNAISIDPNHEFANLNLGLIYFDIKNYKESFKFIINAYKKNNNNLIAIYHLGLINLILNNLEESEKFFLKIIEKNKNDENALLNLAILNDKRKNFEKSIEINKKIIEINPNNINANNNLGVLNHNNLKYDEAINYFKKCIKINDKFIPPYSNLGRVYSDLRRFEDAKNLFNKSIEINNNDYVSKFELSKIFLSTKEYYKGLEFYEYRKKITINKNINILKNNFNSIEWNGQKLDSKIILILAEQGFGDIILFKRYIDVLFKFDQVIFLCNKKLNYIFKESKFKIVNKIEDVGHHDFYQHLLTLPKIYFEKEKKFCKRINYLPNDHKNDLKWKLKLNKLKKIKIGLAWQGNKNFLGDTKRSIPLIKLDKIILNNNFDVISLQKDFGLEQINNNYKNKIYDFSSELDLNDDAFRDTISILKNVDFLITIESSIAQLAGTMGINTYLLLSYNPYWIWYSEQEKAKFYDTIKIYQQDKPGSWDNAINQLEKDLNKYY